MSQALLSCVVILVLAATAFAQPIRWEQTNGPGGGSGIFSSSNRTIVADKASRLFSSTESGIYRSLDRGETWQLVHRTYLGKSLSALAIDDEDRVFAGSSTVGILRSTNHGDSWEVVDAGDTTFGSGYESWIRVAADNHIWGTVSGKVRRSTDNGTTWNDGPIQFGSVSAIDSTGTLLTAYGQGGILRSTDDGKEWYAANVGLNLFEGRLPSITDFLVVRPGIILCGTGTSTTYRSTDGGMSWNLVDSLGSISRAVWFSRGDDDLLYRFSDPGITRSTDEGISWQPTPITEGMPRNGGGFLVLNDGSIYILSEGIRRSNDGGATFVRSDSMMATGNSSSLAIDGAGILYNIYGSSGITRSTDRGDTWGVPGRDSISQTTRFSDLCVTPSGKLYALNGTGLLRSEDGGERFVQLTTPASVVGCVAAPDESIIINTWASGSFQSTDGGTSWSAIRFGFTQEDAMNFGFDSSGGMYAAMNGRGVLRSFDRGETWEESTDSISRGKYRINLVVATRSGTLYAASERIIWRSADRGIHWINIRNQTSTGQSDPSTIRDIAVNRAGDLFLATDYGVERSTDRGETWELLTDGNAPYSVYHLAFDQEDRLYAGTYASGVYRTTAPTSSIPLTPPNPISAVRDLRISPNPVARSARLSFRLDTPQRLTISVVDNRGDVVKPALSQGFGIGNGSVELSMSALPSGEYHVIVRSLRGESVVPLVVVR